MFIFTVKSPLKSKKGIIALTACFALLAALVVCVAIAGFKVPSKTSCDEIGEYSLVAATTQQRAEFLNQFGYISNEESCSREKVIIPSVFNDIYRQYNEIQLKQGLDLNDYKGKCVDKYVYETDEAYFTLLVYDGNVIGGHKCSKDNLGRCLAFYG